MTFLIALVLRSLALLGIAWGVLELVDATSGPVIGANIGAGLAAFGALALAAGFGGLVDGRYRPPLRSAAALWGLVGVVVALGLPFLPQGGPGPELTVYVEDLLVLGWFDLLLVLGPAGLGLALGYTTRGSGAPGAAGMTERPS
ncbi:hypothetical protein [Phycicoccus avicenniae]|uniref:hypothetical protein n=1 Tax=Phycicoccus avicenniae TaxID=2828860 RepID=UPI003D2E87C3